MTKVIKHASTIGDGVEDLSFSAAPKVIDLFSGAGGLSLGLKMAGFEIVAAIEENKHAVGTYQKNIADHIFHADIRQIHPQRLDQRLKQSGLLSRKEEIALIAGGPPCQPFSIMGRSKISSLIKSGDWKGANSRHESVSDERANLFWEFVDFVEYFKPKYFLMENVQGMKSRRTEEGKEIVPLISDLFNQIGYNVNVELLRASDYGVPQNRDRIFFLGSRHDLTNCQFPVPTSNLDPPILIDAIGDLIEIEPTRTGEVFLPGGVHLTGHRKREVNKRDEVLFQFITSGAPSVFWKGVDYKSSQPKRNYGDVYPKMWESHLVPAFKKSGLNVAKTEDKRDCIITNDGRELIMYNPEKFRDKIRRMRWDEPSWTIMAHLKKDSYMFIHPFKNRGITPREAARIQSFPDDFEFEGGMGEQFSQIGNAVPPLLAKILGQEIYKAWKCEIAN